MPKTIRPEELGENYIRIRKTKNISHSLTGVNIRHLVMNHPIWWGTKTKKHDMQSTKENGGQYMQEI